ncbi:MAG: hypothetical protein ACQEXJ_18350 [Myxococcota bacterium]
MSDPQQFQSGDPVPLEAIPEDLRPRIGPDAPEKARMMTARAILPMPPELLGIALSVLARDPDDEIASTARASLADLPREVQEQIVVADVPGPILDVYAHVFRDDDVLARHVVTNRATLDETVRWMGRNLRGSVLDAVASNQVRLVRTPAIVAALIANEATPMPVLARVTETAIRNDVDTAGIPGFRDLANAFHADLAEQRKGKEAGPEEEASEGEEDVDEEAASDTRPSRGLSDEEMEQLLLSGVSGDEAESTNKPLWKLIEDMSLPQRVRLAMVGNATARRILIRDSKKLVANAVLRSPKLTDKEIAHYAQDKAIDGEVIRAIARSREWTKTYAIRKSLVLNPKCPAQQAMGFIRTLRRRDLQSLSRAKDVPAHVSRAAKNLAAKRRM